MQSLFFRWFPALGLVLIVVLFFVTQSELEMDPRPAGAPADIASLADRSDLNLVFILVDTLRADHMGSYGYERDTSPYLDYLASSGAQFDNHFAQSSWTKASMASLWTGLYPVRTGVRRAVDALPEEAKLPTEILSEAGFVTAGIWRNGWVAPNFGFSQGFDIYQTPLVNQMPDSVKPNVRAGRIAGTDIDMVYSAAAFFRTHHDQRFFMYLHLMDVHQYVSDQETAIFGNSYLDSYDNSIRWVDRQIQTIVGELERLGLRDRTLIVIASDHGEAFGEHGAEGHARDVHAEVTTTPWIISFPFRLKDVVITERTANIDIWPTLLDILGLPEMPGTDGVSQLAALTQSSEAGHRGKVRSEFSQIDEKWAAPQDDPRPIVAIRNGRYRLITHLEAPDKTKLYDLQADHTEQKNIADGMPEVRDRLRTELDAYLDQEVFFEGGAHTVEISDLELRQLRALGYNVQ